MRLKNKKYRYFYVAFKCYYTIIEGDKFYGLYSGNPDEAILPKGLKFLKR